MKGLILSIVMLLVGAGLVAIEIANPLYAQGLTLEQIKTNLLNNPPHTGDYTVREETILALDNILKSDSARYAQDVRDFYTFMMEKVKTELSDTVSAGAAIWMMYNHGFVIKTPRDVFAFDLVDGYSGWPTNLPHDLISQIKILFISHDHGDHFDYRVRDAVIAKGGYVVVPSEISSRGNVPMAPSDSTTLLGLWIKAHDGLHSVPVRIYEVRTSNGLKILHTGDNQTSTILPAVDGVDVLLLNAWVNESGWTSAVDGMRNCIYKLNPTVMIPGHIQELGHPYSPDSPFSRVPYEWAFAVDDVPVPAEVQVMAWGERYFVSGPPVGIIDYDENYWSLKSFTLHQNYPNPFNPTTTIRYDLSKISIVVLKIYNTLGQPVRTLVNGRQSAGEWSVVWDGRDEFRKEVGSGVYIYQLKAGDNIQSRKMVLLR